MPKSLFLEIFLNLACHKTQDAFLLKFGGDFLCLLVQPGIAFGIKRSKFKFWPFHFGAMCSLENYFILLNLPTENVSFHILAEGKLPQNILYPFGEFFNSQAHLPCFFLIVVWRNMLLSGRDPQKGEDNYLKYLINAVSKCTGPFSSGLALFFSS